MQPFSKDIDAKFRLSDPKPDGGFKDVGFLGYYETLFGHFKVCCPFSFF